VPPIEIGQAGDVSNIKAIDSRLNDLSRRHNGILAKARVDDLGAGTAPIRHYRPQSLGQHNSLARCVILFHSTVPPPHSHSIVFGYGNALNFQRNFFTAGSNTVRPIRQKFTLLIPRANFGDP
jgi:hypothetical protein